MGLEVSSLCDVCVANKVVGFCSHEVKVFDMTDYCPHIGASYTIEQLTHAIFRYLSVVYANCMGINMTCSIEGCGMNLSFRDHFPPL